MNQIKVQFIGEPAVDQGNPSREYFGLINEAAQRKLMVQSVFRHNISAFTRREYYAFGQLTALVCYKNHQVQDVLSSQCLTIFALETWKI